MNFYRLYRLMAIFALIFILGTTSYSNSNSSIQLNTLVPMSLVGTDEVGDPGYFNMDINEAFMGQTDDYLVFLVTYENLGDWEMYSNVTLRNQNGDLFLIMAVIGTDNHFVFLTHATSLENDSKNTGENDLFVEYTGYNRISQNYTEITFFIDWAHIGGKGPVDVVFWTGRPKDINIDRLPDTGYLTYNGNETIETTGWFDETNTFPPVTTITTTSVFDGEVGNSSVSSSTVTSNTVNDTIDTGVLDTNSDNFNFDLPVSNLFFLPLLLIPLLRRKKQ